MPKRKLVWGAARSAMSHGAKVLTYHRVTRIEREGGRVSAVLCRDEKAGQDVRIDCGFVLNCAGPWADPAAIGSSSPTALASAPSRWARASRVCRS